MLCRYSSSQLGLPAPSAALVLDLDVVPERGRVPKGVPALRADVGSKSRVGVHVVLQVAATEVRLRALRAFVAAKQTFHVSSQQQNNIYAVKANR